MFYLLLAIHLNLIIYISLLERAFEVLDDVLEDEIDGLHDTESALLIYNLGLHALTLMV
jgi:hypothetical protein